MVAAIVLLASGTAAGQHEPCSTVEGWWMSAGPRAALADVPAEVRPFIEKDSVPIELKKADLDRDGREDWLLVIQHAKPRIDPKSGYEEEGLRSLLLLVRGADGRLAAAARNDHVAYCCNCGGIWGDPFVGVDAGAGRFTVSNAGGSNRNRWTYSYTFAWSRIDSAWQLVRVESTAHDVLDPKGESLVVHRPPRDYGKIDFREFDPQDYKGRGPR
ncbi:MAG: hypothetical protein KIT18_12825 [Burkholderiales bacterium]|nr:hypothetical protein [Burkholderiales bacterium]